MSNVIPLPVRPRVLADLSPGCPSLFEQVTTLRVWYWGSLTFFERCLVARAEFVMRMGEDAPVSAQIRWLARTHRIYRRVVADVPTAVYPTRKLGRVVPFPRVQP